MPYVISPVVPDPETFLSLRAAADMAPRSREGVERGLPNTRFGVTARHVDGAGTDRTADEPAVRTADTPPADGRVVGMGRVVGDGGTVYQITDVVVHPDHQDRGVGTAVMEALLGYVDRDAPPQAYVNLLADAEEFYEEFGFEPTAPDTVGMYFWTG